jgi:hypothetical protein
MFTGVKTSGRPDVYNRIALQGAIAKNLDYHHLAWAGLTKNLRKDEIIFAMRRTFLTDVSHNYCHCFSLMSPICGAHQPRRFGSRLMGFLLPEIQRLNPLSPTTLPNSCYA